VSEGKKRERIKGTDNDREGQGEKERCRDRESDRVIRHLTFRYSQNKLTI
jgi:hypothetical protein